MIKAIALLTCIAAPAHADPTCAPTLEMQATIQQTFDGPARWVGVSDKGGLMELYVDAKGEWTLLVTVKGLTCIALTGQVSAWPPQ